MKSWLTDLADELDQLQPFSTQLRPTLEKGSPEAMGEALATDLSHYNGNSHQVVLFIDEFDRAPMDDDFTRFIRAAVANLGDHAQLAFSSRRLTYQPWYDMVANGEAAVLGTEYRKDDVMFTVEENVRPTLEVYSLGRGYALVNGKMITNWDGALPRNLFFYFMDHPLVTRDEIFATFWPDLTIKEATNVFHVTKRKISERISMKVDDNANYELTSYSGGFYMPSDKVFRHYDVADFQDALEQAMIASSDDREDEMLTRAIDLYRAPFLLTVEMDWVQERRESLRQLYTQALISMGRLNKRKKDLRKALGFFLRALREIPEREDIHREVMTIYLNLEMIDDAINQYQTLDKMLHDTLDIGPSRETRELFDLVKARK
ncbi:MAG: bacterial transcriptional activator domain-containing protein [Anaerolineae bacterium]|nr:bacterial transcriptional activator domain-containing protein [Anaerolineae bacterium]